MGGLLFSLGCCRMDDQLAALMQRCAIVHRQQPYAGLFPVPLLNSTGQVLLAARRRLKTIEPSSGKTCHFQSASERGRVRSDSQM